MTASPDILVLGSSGMLGTAVRRELAHEPGWRVEGTQSEDSRGADYLDVLGMPKEEWAGRIGSRRWDYIVNCIGILKPAVDEQNPVSLARAIRVNALFPHELAAVLPQTRIIHLSTDGVFSGEQDRPYVETDPADCRDAYGRTKALGECPAANVLNFRCSIVGRDVAGGKGLVEWVLRAPEGTELTGFDDQWWNGVTTNQFGELCRRIIGCAAFDGLRAVAGVHHFCPNPPLTKYELLCHIQEAAGRRIAIRRGQSGSPGRRILGTIYTAVTELFPGGENWESLARKALAAEPAL